MCVRTKTSYGCGHAYKDTCDCHSDDCEGIVKFHYSKDGDCSECKRGERGTMRGRDRCHRYSQETRRMSRRRRSTDSSRQLELIRDTSHVERVPEPRTPAKMPREDGDDVATNDPWAPSDPAEKSWHSPHRRKADEGWLTEHEDRMLALQELSEKCSISDHPRPPPPTFEVDLIDAHPRPSSRSYHPHKHRDLPPQSYRAEYRIPRSSSHSRSHDYHHHSQYHPRHSHSRSQSHHEDRQYSYDSLPESMPSYRSSPRVKYSLPTYNYNQPSLEYDYYTAAQSRIKSHSKRHYHRSDGSSRAHTDLFSTPRSSPSHLYHSELPPVIVDRDHDYSRSKHSGRDQHGPRYSSSYSPDYAKHHPTYW